jgi:hypothetical protein
MMIRPRVIAAVAAVLCVVGALLLALGPTGSAQESVPPAPGAPAKGPQIKYLPAIEEGHTVELSHVETFRSGKVEEWRQWAWLEAGVRKWVRSARVGTLNGPPGPLLNAQIDDGVTCTAVAGLGTKDAKVILEPSAQSTPVWSGELPIWACDPAWLRHWYGLYPWAWVRDIPNTTWNGVRVNTLGVGTAPRDGQEPWAQARQMLQYEPGTANLVGVDYPSWRGPTTWRAAVVDTRPSTSPEDLLGSREWRWLPIVDNRDLCPAYFVMFGPEPMTPDPGAIEWLATFRDKAGQVLRGDPKRLEEFVPGLIDRPSGAQPDELQTLEWQELNTRLFVTLSDEQLEALAAKRGVILGEATSLTDEQRNLLAKIWGVSEFVTDPGCERVKWCGTAFAYGGEDYLVVIRRAPGLVKAGWLANQGFKDAPPAISG